MEGDVRGHVVLVGMMGSGKSTVGALLAGRLSLPFCDTDALVEQSAGRSIAEIIGGQGEAAFRALERAALRDALAAPRQVIATGGGVVLDAANRAALRQATVVFLQAPAEVLLARVRATEESRPLLQGESLARRIDALLDERERLYEEVARHTVRQGAGDDAEKIAAELARLIALPA